MFSKQDFDNGMERAIQCWMEGLLPANGMERRLVRSIARQDFLMCVLMKDAIEFNDDTESTINLRLQRDLGATLDSLVHAISTLQRQRLALEPLPQPPPMKAKAKVVPISRFTSARPKKVEPDPEPHVGQRDQQREPGLRNSLDLKLAS